MENNKTNLKIYGSRDCQGGVYNEVIIGGSGDIDGDIECNIYNVMGSGDLNGNLKTNIANISGSGDIEGDVEAKEITISGSGDIEGNVKSDKIIINGSGDIEGDVNCKTITINGSGDIEGNIYAEEINIMGSTDIGGNCEAEIFNGSGSFDIEGFLNAGKINIQLNGRCEINEIGGEKIHVKVSNNYSTEDSKGFFKRVFKQKPELFVEVIEGDDIYLENTTAEIVRGCNVVIGPGCEIGAVEYINDININEDKDKIKLV